MVGSAHGVACGGEQIDPSQDLGGLRILESVTVLYAQPQSLLIMPLYSGGGTSTD